MTELLQVEEQQELAQCEAIIEKGLQTFFEVGNALSTIRNKKLYKAAHKTFEEYCKHKWGFQRQYANRLIAASETVAVLVPIGTIPENEAQIRPLINLEDEVKYAIWDDVTKQSLETGEPVTAKKVKEHVDAYLESNPAIKTNSELKKIQRIEDKIKSNPIPADEQRRIDELKAGNTVVLNLHTDLHLLKYAMDNNLLVRCDGVSDWRNPFTVNVDGNYKEVYNLFKKMYLPYKKELLNRISELKGKALGAYCYPEKCHCEVLKEWVEKGG